MLKSYTLTVGILEIKHKVNVFFGGKCSKSIQVYKNGADDYDN